jgi:hypothetical protein
MSGTKMRGHHGSCAPETMRACRILDGMDEVHAYFIGRSERYRHRRAAGEVLVSRSSARTHEAALLRVYTGNGHQSIVVLPGAQRDAAALEERLRERFGGRRV